MIGGQVMAEPPSLLSTVLELGFAKAEDLQEVQARQVIYGGDQQLNLLELELVDEGQLLSALSHMEGLPSASAGPVLMDLQLTAQLRAGGVDGIAGLTVNGDQVVTVGHRGNLTPNQIESLLGGPCQLVVTTSLRMDEAMAMFTGDELSARVSATLNHLGPRLRLTPASRPPPADEADPSLTVTAIFPPVEPIPVASAVTSSAAANTDLQGGESNAVEDDAEDHPTLVSGDLAAFSDVEAAHKTASVRPSALGDKSVQLLDETAPPPVGYEEIAAFSAAPELVGQAAHPKVERNIYQLSEAQQDLSAALNRDRIVEVLVHYASSIFEYTAAFSITSNQARGLRASGGGASSEEVKQLTIPLDLPSALQLSKSKKVTLLAKLRASGVEGGIARDLKRKRGIDVLLSPVILQDRAVILVWCDNGGAPIPEQARRSFEELIPQVADALTRLVLEKKRASRPPEPFDVASLMRAPNRKTEIATNEALFSPPVPEEPMSETPAMLGRQQAVTVLATPAPKRHSRHPMDSIPGPAALAPPRALLPFDDESGEEASPGREDIQSESGAGESRSSNPASSIPPSNPTRPGIAHIVPHPLHGKENAAATRRNPAAPPHEGAERHEVAEQHEVAEPKKRTLTRPTQNEGGTRSESDPPGSFPPEAPRTLKGYPEAKSTKLASTQDTLPHITGLKLSHHAPPPLLSRRIVPLGKSLRPPAPAIGTRPGIAPAFEESKSTKSIPPPEAPPYELSEAYEIATGVALGRADDRAKTLVSRRPIPPSDPSIETVSDEASSSGKDENSSAGVGRELDQSDLKRPKSFSDLVAELLQGNDSVLPQILEGGETAVGALIAEFPGPVREPESPSEKASECGPILSALASLGSKSLPFVTVRTADENARVRRWATFLLGELPGKESAKAIANRLLDASIEVRRAALISARRVRRDQLTRRSLRAQVEQMCRDQSLDAEARCSAVEAIADIREHEAIPVLLQLLDDFSPNVVRSARWALCVLTRQDFGDDTDGWRRFWQQHRDEDRVEWLISSLDHNNRDIRRASGDELRALCGNDFGYDEDQSQTERRRAQADFRTWWNETGKARLH